MSEGSSLPGGRQLQLPALDPVPGLFPRAGGDPQGMMSGGGKTSQWTSTSPKGCVWTEGGCLGFILWQWAVTVLTIIQVTSRKFYVGKLIWLVRLKVPRYYNPIVYVCECTYICTYILNTFCMVWGAMLPLATSSLTFGSQASQEIFTCNIQPEVLREP